MRLLPLAFLLATACVAPATTSSDVSNQGEDSSEGKTGRPTRQRGDAGDSTTSSPSSTTSHPTPAHPFDKELRTEHGATINDYAGLIATSVGRGPP